MFSTYDHRNVVNILTICALVRGLFQFGPVITDRAVRHRRLPTHVLASDPRSPYSAGTASPVTATRICSTVGRDRLIAKKENQELQRRVVVTPRSEASKVKELRSSSGASLLECKKALLRCGGDVTLALAELRKGDKGPPEPEPDTVA